MVTPTVTSISSMVGSGVAHATAMATVRMINPNHTEMYRIVSPLKLRVGDIYMERRQPCKNLKAEVGVLRRCFRLRRRSWTSGPLLRRVRPPLRIGLNLGHGPRHRSTPLPHSNRTLAAQCRPCGFAQRPFRNPSVQVLPFQGTSLMSPRVSGASTR